MIKLTGFVLVTAALLATSSAFAGDKKADHGCCAQGVANKDGSMNCVNFASLNLNDDQKSKIESWQAECMKAGCTKESRHTFLQQAQGILSAEQFAQLKKACTWHSSHDAKKTES